MSQPNRFIELVYPIFGAGLIAAGCAWAYRPLGLIMLGLLMLGAAFLGKRRNA
jgi:hypothetical protein